MQRKKLILAFIALIFLTNLTLILHSANAVSCVGGGALSITGAPATVNFAAKGTNLSDTTTGIVFGSSLLFEDMRNISANFTLTLTSTDEADTSLNSTFSLTNISIKSDDNNTVGLVDCDPATGITLDATSFSAFIDTDSDGTSDSKTIVTGDTRARIGKYSVEPELQLTVPGRTPAGTFRTTLTYSIQ